jgi:hypothetical protein
MIFKSAPNRWLLVVLISFLATLCHGQNRPVRILYFKAPEGAPTEAYLYSGIEMVAHIDLPRSNFSQTFEIPRGNQEIRFLKTPITERQKIPKYAPAVRIPEAWQKALLLVFDDPNNPVMPITVKAIDASDNVFGPGSICAINFSKIGVIGTIGDKELKLGPMTSQIISDPIPENGYYPTKLFGVTERGAKPRRFIKQMWQHEQDTRQVLFILPKPAPRHATYYCAPIRDF